MNNNCDIIIRNGTIVDGTGANKYIGDIVILGDTIIDVGPNVASKYNMPNKQDVDATGKHILPGWVDAHTHFDAQMHWDPFISPSSAAGVTTVCMGNCSVSLAPCPKDLRGFISEICDSIEDIPVSAMKEAVNWNWETWPEYYEELSKRKFACDVCSFVGHSAIRTWVLGARANASDRPNGQIEQPLTPEEIEKVGKVVEEAVAAGALGVSTSRISVHRDRAGVLLPGSLASNDELRAMAQGVARGGGGSLAIACSFDLYDDYSIAGYDKVKAKSCRENDWKVMEELSMIPSLNVTFGTGGNDFHQLERLKNVIAKGGALTMTPMFRHNQTLFSLRSGLHPLMVSETFRKVREKFGGKDGMSKEFLLKLQQDEIRNAVLTECKHAAKTPRSSFWTQVMYQYGDRIFPYSPFDLEPRPEESVNGGGDPWRKLYNIISNPQDPVHNGIAVRYTMNYEKHTLEPLRRLLIEHDAAIVPGFADGGAHVTAQCEATTATTMLSFWCRDRKLGPLLPLEITVKKFAYDQAKMLGLDDRGVLAVGKRADVNIVDMSCIGVLAPTFARDIPGGNGRWVQETVGYDMTICAGIVTFENGIATGELPGRLVRNPKSTGMVPNGLRGSVPHGPTFGASNSKSLKEYALKLQRNASGPSAAMKIIQHEEETRAAANNNNSKL